MTSWNLLKYATLLRWVLILKFLLCFLICLLCNVQLGALRSLKSFWTEFSCAWGYWSTSVFSAYWTITYGFYELMLKFNLSSLNFLFGVHFMHVKCILGVLDLPFDDASQVLPGINNDDVNPKLRTYFWLLLWKSH